MWTYSAFSPEFGLVIVRVEKLDLPSLILKKTLSKFVENSKSIFFYLAV